MFKGANSQTEVKLLTFGNQGLLSYSCREYRYVQCKYTNNVYTNVLLIILKDKFDR